MPFASTILPEPEGGLCLPSGPDANFGDYIPPSTSVVMERCFNAAATMSISLIGVLPETGYEIHKVHPPGVASAPTSGFVRLSSAAISSLSRARWRTTPAPVSTRGRASAGAFRLGRHRDPQADRIS